MALRRNSLYYPDFWKPSVERHSTPVYENLRTFQEQYNNELVPVSRRLGTVYSNQKYQKPETCLKRRIARTQSERRPINEHSGSSRRNYENFDDFNSNNGVLYTNLKRMNNSIPEVYRDKSQWSQSLQREKYRHQNYKSETRNLESLTYRPERRSCSDLIHAAELHPPSISKSFQNLAKDLEYGPGIVEKLRAKFSKMSEAQKSFQTQTKIFNSCDDLRSEEECQRQKKSSNFHAEQDLKKCTARTVSDVVNLDDSELTIPSKQAQQIDSETSNEARSIVQLCRRFEKNGDQITKMRFARDPMALITKFHPDGSDQPDLNSKLFSTKRPSNTLKNNNLQLISKTSPQTNSLEISSPTKTKNVLKVLNDGEPTEPEFIRIARRLRRLEPEIIPVNVGSPAEETITEKGAFFKSTHWPSSIAKWNKRQPETSNLLGATKTINEASELMTGLPTDPHSARDPEHPIPTISSNRETIFTESSPPPEEPKPTTTGIEHSTPLRKMIVDLPSERNSIGTVFKYDNPRNIENVCDFSKPSQKNHHFSSSTPEIVIIGFTGRYVEDISSKSTVTTVPNVVSITVKGPSSNRLLTKYDKHEETDKTVGEAASSLTKTNSSYTTLNNSNFIKKIQNSYSLSSKYVEEKYKTSVAPSPPTLSKSSNNAETTSKSQFDLLSPHEKPYGDDVTILKSDASNQINNYPTKNEFNNIVPKDESEDSNTSSDDDSSDGITGSYDVKSLRPNSLMFTRIKNEEEVGGDGNTVSRSLISLIAEEDLPDFLVALHEKPVNYIVVEESQKPGTSSILRSREVKKEKNGNRIRFCTESPMAYAYLDEITAMRSLQWDDGTIIEYSYLKELEEKESLDEDPTMAMIEKWEQQICTSKDVTSITESSFKEESALNTAY